MSNRSVLFRRWAAALLTLAPVLIPGTGERFAAHAAAAPDWEPTGLGEPVLELYTPASGLLFARTRDGLSRSDDAGATWTAVSLPPSPRAVAVDPTDHTTLYVAGAAGLYKTADDAATWTLVLPLTERALRIAVSPADSQLVYLALTGPQSISADFRLLRSRDGGITWEQLQEAHNSLCGWSVLILQPHPTDAGRLLRTAGCYAGRNLQDSLEQSTDRGATWADLLRPELSFPSRVVGGRGVAPGRFYLAANRDGRAGGSSVFRSTDDGASWTEVLAFRGGGTEDRPAEPDVRIGGLAFNPSEPDRVYVGLNRYVGQFSDRTRTGSGVRVSADGGVSWADLCGQDLGEISDLALGSDGLNLYAATDRGLWRFRSPDRPPACGPSTPPPVQVPTR